MVEEKVKGEKGVSLKKVYAKVFFYIIFSLKRNSDKKKEVTKVYVYTLCAPH